MSDHATHDEPVAPSADARERIAEVLESPCTPVQRFVSEIVACVREIENQREQLRAHGIPLRTTRQIVELGVQSQQEKQATMIDGALAMSAREYGESAMSREELERRIGQIVDLEKLLTHVRVQAREQDIDTQALGFLTQVMQQNPGDGGARVIDRLRAYAVECGVELARGPGSVGGGAADDSVLPKIERDRLASAHTAGSVWWREGLVGLALGVSMLWLLT